MDHAADRLRAVGLRITRPRVAVLTAVAAHPHADVDAIAASARAGIGSVSTQAIYDVVHALTEAGLLRCIEPAGSPARFELDTGDNHHHLVCRACHRIVDVACAIGRAPCLQPSDDAGYRLDQAEVTYWGVCAGCQSRTDAVHLRTHEPSREPVPPPTAARHHHLP